MCCIALALLVVLLMHLMPMLEALPEALFQHSRLVHRRAAAGGGLLELEAPPAAAEAAREEAGGELSAVLGLDKRTPGSKGEVVLPPCPLGCVPPVGCLLPASSLLARRCDTGHLGPLK